MPNTISKITQYLNDWKDVNSKHFNVENDPYFINAFIDFLEEYSADDLQEGIELTFDGSGAYFGKQFIITLKDNVFNSRNDVKTFGFEIVHDKNKIVIYTNKHNGFWVAPYISMDYTHRKFKELYTAWTDFLRSNFGL
jgi:hypothetical protein